MTTVDTKMTRLIIIQPLLGSYLQKSIYLNEPEMFAQCIVLMCFISTAFQQIKNIYLIFYAGDSSIL